MLFLQGVRNSSLRTGGGLCGAHTLGARLRGFNLEHSVYRTTTSRGGPPEGDPPLEKVFSIQPRLITRTTW